MSELNYSEQDQSEATETTTFTLETDDTPSEDGPSKTKSSKKSLLPSPFGICDSDSSKVPMDTDYQEEVKWEPKVRIKSDVFGGVKRQNSAGRFDMNRLFEAVASRDVSQLDGLHDYLRLNVMKLTHSKLRDPRNGKTALLKALLNMKDGRNKTIEVLLNIAEQTDNLKDFINAVYIDSYYKGQSALHVAIERRSMYFVQLLVQKGANVHARACGKFFQLNKGPGFYFGELPLSLAACTNQLDIVSFLMDNPHQKVNVMEKDSMGNTVLHALVVVADNTPENTKFVTRMYDEILIRAAKLHPEIKLENSTNNKGLTPLKLAARTGKIGLFQHMVNREMEDRQCRHLSRRFTEWVYGPVHSSLFDLSSLDSFEKNSVMEIIVFGSSVPNRQEMLQVEPLNRLLQDKWERFASRMFFINFFFYIMYLAIFTTVAYNRLDGTPPFPVHRTPQGCLRLTGQLICLLGAIYLICKGIVDFRRKRPTLETLLVDGFCEILFFLQAIFFLISSVLYTSGNEEYVALLVLSLALAWINLLYYSRGFKLLGIYSVMIQKMILGDILRFLFVYMVFLFGFSAALVTLIEDVPAERNATEVNRTQTNAQPPPEDCQKPSFNNIIDTTQELFKFTIGMGDLEFTEQYAFKKVFYFLLISYIVLTYILLFNMLIALMGKTVDKISNESKCIWKLQRAITILDLERNLPTWLKCRLRSGVVKELGRSPGEDSRRCFRVEEVNWSRWNSNLGIINEDPGNEELHRHASPQARDQRWHRSLALIRNLSTRRNPPPDEEEMATLS
ncbi:transient receptor potential cation channel subfamily V member 1 isoform X2 [Amia ocellicauda]